MRSGPERPSPGPWQAEGGSGGGRPSQAAGAPSPAAPRAAGLGGSSALRATLATLLLTLLSLYLPARAGAAGELARAREARTQFFQGKDAAARDSWLRLITRFEEASAAQVRDTFRAQADLEGAELALQCFYRFRDQKDAVRAERLSRKAVKSCARCPTAPKAEIILGRALTALRRMDDAYRELMKVELNHPDAPEIEEARELMTTLRAGGTPPPYPTAEPAVLSGARPPAGAAPPGTASPAGSGALPGRPAPPARPTAARGGDGSGGAPAREGAATGPGRGTPPAPAKPPVKPPPPRKDGLAQVYAVTVERRQGYTAVVAWTDRVTSYVYNLIPPQRSGGFHRVYADIRGARLAGGLPGASKSSPPLVRLVKINQFSQDTARLVMDLPEPYPYAPVFLDDPPRLELRVAGEAEDLPPTEADAPPEPRKAPDPPPRAGPGRGARGPADSLARQLGLKIRRVVIDPGHGGKDGGAAGNGLREKDVALKAARMLKAKIERRLGLEVVLTRDSDRFVTLDRRTRIVRDSKGDLFISVHCNANTLSSVEGLETYLLNFATDPSAQTVAARENASSQKSMSEMAGILDLIAKNTRVAESRVLARTVHGKALGSLRTRYKVRDLGVKEAVFLVLVNADVPAILMEIGFLTNKREAERLSQDAYLELLTDGVTDGLKAYVDGLPH
ncbi:MAG: N-acetylmuramoyl-L-alanine amidase [Deltaproteobacteria bacterium]|nr:N-acetylmuramoyl-L-alanine amidase [Deltaproteobacteria bacterium]